MEYGPSDSSGTDDDLPPHHNTGRRVGHATGNGRSASGALPYPRGHHDMESQIHWLEQEAYSSVLRAFKAQSDAITWEKESLITELRKELRVSDEEHRELLSRVNADDVIRRIREWRQTGGSQPGFLNNSQPVRDSSPTASASRKRQKTSQSIPSLSLTAPTPVMQTQVAVPSHSTGIRGSSLSSKSKKAKSIPSTGPLGNSQIVNKNSSVALAPGAPDGTAGYNPLIGRKVWTRWPEDNSFYEAVITDFNQSQGLHALVYGINSKDESWEWVNLKEIPPEDIRWEGEDPGIYRLSDQTGAGPRIRKPGGQSGAFPGAARGRGPLPNKDLGPSTNGLTKKSTDEIEIPITQTLIKEVEKIFAVSHPDPLDVEKAKNSLREQERSLVDAITILEGVLNVESGEGDVWRGPLAVEPTRS